MMKDCFYCWKICRRYELRLTIAKLECLGLLIYCCNKTVMKVNLKNMIVWCFYKNIWNRKMLQKYYQTESLTSCSFMRCSYYMIENLDKFWRQFSWKKYHACQNFFKNPKFICKKIRRRNFYDPWGGHIVQYRNLMTPSPPKKVRRLLWTAP